MRRSLVTSFACLLLLGAALIPTLAVDDNTVQNMKGDVSYQTVNGPPQPIAVNASVALINKDSMITAASSLAQVTLPDSSTVEIGEASKIQMASFNQTTLATAKFFLYNGTVRFAVRHPQGAQANYTFQTATGSIAVRGTQGDIASDTNGNLQVNVYEVCNPSQPVTVTPKGGQPYAVNAGQSYVGQYINGQLQSRVEQLTNQLIDRFSPQFGIPTSWDQATGEVVGYANNKIQTGVNNVTGGYGGGLVPSVGGLFKKKSTPAPAPTSSTCTHN